MGDISMKKCKQFIDIISIILLIIEICLLFYFAYINWSKIAGIINIYIILAVTFFVGFRILLDKSNIIKEVFCIFLNVFILSISDNIWLAIILFTVAGIVMLLKIVNIRSNNS